MLLNNLVQAAQMSGQRAQRPGEANVDYTQRQAATPRGNPSQALNALMQMTQAPQAAPPKPIRYERHGAVRQVFDKSQPTMAEKYRKMKSPSMSPEMRRMTLGA